MLDHSFQFDGFHKTNLFSFQSRLLSATNFSVNMSAPRVDLSTLQKGVVKQVLSGNSVILYQAGGLREQTNLVFQNIIVPNLTLDVPIDESPDASWAWESREFLRSNILGKEVYFYCERPPKNFYDYGVIYLGSDPNTSPNVTELLISKGLVSVRRDNRSPTPEQQRLYDLEDAAKNAQKGKWGTADAHVPNIKWTEENVNQLRKRIGCKLVKAFIENVQSDGITVRAVVLPDFQFITLRISRIRCTGFKLDADGKPDKNIPVDFAENARYFVESRLLQRDVNIVLESVTEAICVGSILFPDGNISEAENPRGFAQCVDWHKAFVKTGVDKLRQAKRQANDLAWTGVSYIAQQSIEEFDGDASNVHDVVGITWWSKTVDFWRGINDIWKWGIACSGIILLTFYGIRDLGGNGPTFNYTHIPN